MEYHNPPAGGEGDVCVDPLFGKETFLIRQDIHQLNNQELPVIVTEKGGDEYFC